MESKIPKGTHPKIDPIVTLQQKIKKLQIQNESLKVKLLKLETIKLKQEQKIIRLQAENQKLHNEGLMQMVVEAVRHNEPPEK